MMWFLTQRFFFDASLLVCPLLEVVVSDHGLPSVTAGKSDGYLGSCLQVVPQKLCDEFRLTGFTEITVIYNNHHNRRLKTWWKIQKK